MVWQTEHKSTRGSWEEHGRRIKGLCLEEKEKRCHSSLILTSGTWKRVVLKEVLFPRRFRDLRKSTEPFLSSAAILINRYRVLWVVCSMWMDIHYTRGDIILKKHVEKLYHAHRLPHSPLRESPTALDRPTVARKQYANLRGKNRKQYANLREKNNNQKK